MSEAGLFVYGTLRSEFDNPFAHRLHSEAELAGRASVRGSIFRISSYPGYRKQPDGVVHGELWRLKNAARTLAALDNYEGPEYQRVQVELESPREQAWIYLYVSEVRAENRIESGDFLRP